MSEANTAAVAGTSTMRSNQENHQAKDNVYVGDALDAFANSSPQRGEATVANDADPIVDDKVHGKEPSPFGIASESFVDIGTSLSNSQCLPPTNNTTITTTTIEQEESAPSSDLAPEQGTDLGEIFKSMSLLLKQQQVQEDDFDKATEVGDVILDENEEVPAEEGDVILDENENTELEEKEDAEHVMQALYFQNNFVIFRKRTLWMAAFAHTVMFLLIIYLVWFHFKTVSRLENELLQCQKSMSLSGLTSDLGDKIHTVEASLVSNAEKALEAAADATHSFSAWMNESIANLLDKLTNS